MKTDFGLRDTGNGRHLNVDDGWSEVVVRFDHATPKEAPYMYHFHIPEHEDCSVMGQFAVG